MKSSSKSCKLMTSSYRKKNKVDWTKELHNKFLKAIEKLGVDNAVPNKILKLMKVEGLTRDHVASHLQKYRALLKKIADGNYGFQIASKPTLLESSMTYGNQWQTNQVIIHEPKNWPILDTSSSYIYALEASRSNGATPSQLAHSGSLPNQGYYMQSLSNNLCKQWSLNDDAAKLDVVNSIVVNSVEFTNSEVMQNRDGYTYAYGGGSTDVNPYRNIKMGSSGGEYSNNELAMSWNHEINLTNTGIFNDVESNNSSQNKNNEMVSLYDFNLNCNLESEIGEDDLMLQEADIASLLSYVNHDSEYGSTSNNQPVTLNPQNQNHNEDHVSEHQTLDEYLQGLDPTFNMQHVEPLMEPIWHLEPVTNDMFSKGKLKAYV